MSSTCHSALRTWMVRTRRISPKHPRIWKHATDLEVGARGVILWAPLGYNTQRERACLRALRMLWTITPPSKLVSCHGDSFHIWKIGCTGFTKPITDWQLQAAGLNLKAERPKLVCGPASSDWLRVSFIIKLRLSICRWYSCARVGQGQKHSGANGRTAAKK